MAPITALRALDAPYSAPTQLSGDRMPQAGGSTVTQSSFYFFYFLRWDMIRLLILDVHAKADQQPPCKKAKKAVKKVLFSDLPLEPKDSLFDYDPIPWPLRLFDDAADYDYTNDTIQNALYESYSCICDILTGRQSHPITALFSTHMAQQRTKFLKANPNRRTTTNNLLEAASCFPFWVPILPGDASLTVDFMSSLLHHVGDQLIDDCAIEGIGQALFNLVILRTYLDRPPENDLDIFEAVRDGHIARIWTSHELALAAVRGEDDASRDAIFDTVPNPDLWGIKVVRDAALELAEDHPFVAIKQPITWSHRPGLTGGSLKPRHYKPPYLRLSKPGPRPKPRPAYGKKVTTDAPMSSLATAYPNPG